MKKLVKVLIIWVMIAAIVLLSIFLHYSNKDLKIAENRIAEMSFTEGEVVEGDSGGTVTVSLKKALYFESDDFITEKKVVGNSIEKIFCELHKRGFITSFDGNLAKVIYTKQVVVKEGGTEKCYYLVGDYYITLQK